jgi:hypothetical protein
MADHADITGDNDFNEEKLKQHLNRRITDQVPRGNCLFCKEPVPRETDEQGQPKPLKLYCSDDCKEDFEREQLIKGKTGRMIERRGF